MSIPICSGIRARCISTSMACRLRLSLNGWGIRDVETKLIYAHADTEMKRKAIDAATSKNSLLREHLDLDRYTVSDEEMIKRLYELR